MEIIKTNQLTKIYSDNGMKVLAVNNVDISIKQGEFTAIVGPSGSGKTTFCGKLSKFLKEKKSKKVCG